MEEQMGQEHAAMKVWRIVYPLLFYYAVVLVTMTIAQWIVGAGSGQYVLCQLIASLVAIPCMLPFYRQDQALRGAGGAAIRIGKAELLHTACAVMLVLLFSVSLNNLISMTPLVELSAGFQEANEGFYGGTLFMELVSSAVVTPILEELVFRGIVFGRLRDMCPRTASVILSAFCFALVHFNVVQFLYALLVGLVLALLVECAGQVYVAAAGHIAANAVAVVRTETGFLSGTVDGSALAWGVSAALLVLGLALLFLYCRRFLSGRQKVIV